MATQDQLFDELSRLRESTDGASNTTSFDVDFNGNVTGETDALSRVTAQAYDALDRLETITDANTNNVSMTYDDRGNLLTVTDQRGIVTTYVYDGLDNLIQESSNDAGTVVYYYDAAGNLTADDHRQLTSSRYGRANLPFTIKRQVAEPVEVTVTEARAKSRADLHFWHGICFNLTSVKDFLNFS